ncbi:MAG TPA: YIP1 family protein [Gaiellaceae bacterium]
MQHAAEGSPAMAMSWWKRAPLVLLAPSAVFVGLREESVEDNEDRQEPLAAIVGLAGVAVVLVSPTFRRMLNDPSVSLVLVPVLAFISGALYAVATYWLGGGLLFGGARRLGGQGSYRRARQTISLASAPLALAMLTFWPVRIAIYGRDLFRTGGDDYGRGDAIFGGIFLGFVAWSLILLVIGVRTTHGWTWPRAAGAVALAAVFPALIVAATTI